MDITPVISERSQRIEGYGNGGFTVSGTRLEGSVLVFPDHTMPWGVIDISQLTTASFQPIFDAQPPVEILLLGCGATHPFVEPALREACRAKGIALDAMDTGAACRTYNILLGEARRVGAALIAV